jgi:hypothetical protein
VCHIHTHTCQNYSLVYRNAILHVNSNVACGNRTLRVEINLVRIEITLVRVVTTFVRVVSSSECQNHTHNHIRACQKHNAYGT